MEVGNSAKIFLDCFYCDKNLSEKSFKSMSDASASVGIEAESEYEKEFDELREKLKNEKNEDTKCYLVLDLFAKKIKQMEWQSVG